MPTPPLAVLITLAIANPSATVIATPGPSPDDSLIATPVLSPDDSLIAYVVRPAWEAYGAIWLVSTGERDVPRRLADGIGPSWSPDGTKLAFQGLRSGLLQIVVWERRTGVLRQVTRLAGGIRPNGYVNVAGSDQAVRLSWSPDSRCIVFASEVETKAEPVRAHTPVVLDRSAPAPQVWAGILRSVWAGFRYVGGGIEWTNVSDSVALRSGRSVSQLFVADMTTGLVTGLTRDEGGAFDADWSPDGRSIVFESAEGEPMITSRLRETNLYLMRLRDSSVRAITSGAGRKHSPRWSGSLDAVSYEYQADPWAMPTTQVVSLATGHVITDSADVAATLARDGRTGDRMVLRLSEDRKHLSLQRPSAQARPILDLPMNTTGHLLGRTRQIEWAGARGARIRGELRLPSTAGSDRLLPLVVDPYAEWEGNDTLLAAGYAVLSPQPRAPHSPGPNSAAYRQLSADSAAQAVQILIEDVLAGVDSLITAGLVDSDRVVLAGFSNGGGVVNYLITRTNRFRCAIAKAPAGGDISSDFFLNPDTEYWLSQLNGATPWTRPASYVELSPVYFADRVRTPVMYVIGDRDGLPFVANAIEMYVALRRLKRPVTLVRYGGEGHVFSEWARIDLASRARRFFDECLAGEHH